MQPALATSDNWTEEGETSGYLVTYNINWVYGAEGNI